ncbi:unnamed protein product [Mesocestoides corti]|uniref:Uncharacterized protein n=1 Tax=Mesocestoides corti TaxID=53468 RepID=A0A0R3UP55_MESCO|nr:unnamed protein product [Mesocestoides corti]
MSFIPTYEPLSWPCALPNCTAPPSIYKSGSIEEVCLVFVDTDSPDRWPVRGNRSPPHASAFSSVTTQASSSSSSTEAVSMLPLKQLRTALLGDRHGAKVHRAFSDVNPPWSHESMAHLAEASQMSASSLASPEKAVPRLPAKKRKFDWGSGSADGDRTNAKISLPCALPSRYLGGVNGDTQGTPVLQQPTSLIVDKPTQQLASGSGGGGGEARKSTGPFADTNAAPFYYPTSHIPPKQEPSPVKQRKLSYPDLSFTSDPSNLFSRSPSISPSRAPAPPPPPSSSSVLSAFSMRGDYPGQPSSTSTSKWDIHLKKVLLCGIPCGDLLHLTCFELRAWLQSSLSAVNDYWIRLWHKRASRCAVDASHRPQLRAAAREAACVTSGRERWRERESGSGTRFFFFKLRARAFDAREARHLGVRDWRRRRWRWRLNAVHLTSTCPLAPLSSRRSSLVVDVNSSSISGSNTSSYQARSSLPTRGDSFRPKGNFSSPPPPPPPPPPLNRYPSHHSEAGRRYSVFGAPSGLSLAARGDFEHAVAEPASGSTAYVARRHSSVLSTARYASSSVSDSSFRPPHEKRAYNQPQFPVKRVPIESSPLFESGGLAESRPLSAPDDKIPNFSAPHHRSSPVKAEPPAPNPSPRSPTRHSQPPSLMDHSVEIGGGLWQPTFVCCDFLALSYVSAALPVVQLSLLFRIDEHKSK